MQQLKQSSNTGMGAPSRTAPALARFTIYAVVAAALSGAVYLVAVRGEALLVDLAAIAAWCF